MENVHMQTDANTLWLYKMCEILVSISELVIGILMLKNFCLPINTGLSASAFVKCLKCLTGLSFENESDLEEYRLAEFEYLLIRNENIWVLETSQCFTYMEYCVLLV